MQIDWLTVAAQVVNFLVLVLLLQRFLYRPIIVAMDRREQRISDRLREADEKASAADDQRHKLEAERKELEEKRNELLSQAKEAAAKMRQSLEREVRKKIQHKEQEWQRDIAEERESFLEDVRRRATESFQHLARRALGDLANAKLEEQVIRVFIDRLRQTDADVLEKLAEACRSSGAQARVRSSFPIPAALKTQLTKLVHEQLGDGIEVEYEETRGRLACGIELSAEGQSVSWTIDGYLDELERRLGQALPAANGIEEPDQRDDS